MERMPPEVHRLPNAYHFGQIDDPEARMNACFTLGQTLAAQCATFGINMDFAPVMDIWSNPDNTVIGERAFGSDAATVTGAANETALGILSGGVIPVAKHFPGHGDTETDSHLGLPVVDKTKEELLDFELRPFRQAIDTTCVFGTYGGDTSIPAIMVGHILVSQIDPERPASLSPAVVTGLRATAWERPPYWRWRPGATCCWSATRRGAWRRPTPPCWRQWTAAASPRTGWTRASGASSP